MPRAFRHPLTLLLVLLALAAGGFIWLQRRGTAPLAGPPQRPAPPQPLALAGGPALGALAPAPKPPAATSRPPTGGKTLQQAYRFALRSGQISLEGVELLQGDFHKRRGTQPWRPGMWCVRFLDADMRVLAQETTAAPDEPCVVLDPNVPDAKGAPQAAKLKLTDDVEMQMRLPPVSGAAWIKIYRIANSKPAGWDVEPMGQLLASIPLPP